MAKKKPKRKVQTRAKPVQKKTRKNVGITDRILRILVALLIIVLTYSYRASIGTVWEWVLYIIALLLIITVIRGRCVPYEWLGINTRGR